MTSPAPCDCRAVPCACGPLDAWQTWLIRHILKARADELLTATADGALIHGAAACNRRRA